MRRLITLASLFGGALLGISGEALATTYFVNGDCATYDGNGLAATCASSSGGLGAKRTIQKGVDAATQVGDIVIVLGRSNQAEYSGCGNYGVLVTRSITITCDDFNGPCVVNPSGCPSGVCSLDVTCTATDAQCSYKPRRAFDFDTDSSAVLDGFKMKNGCVSGGTDPFGGAVRATSTQLIVRNCTFEGNAAAAGGGAFRLHDATGGASAASTTATAIQAAWWIAPAYAVGVLSTVFHLSNGIWTSLITWGVTIRPRTQRASGYVCAVFGVALALVGLGALRGFKTFGTNMATAKVTQAERLRGPDVR